MNLKKKRDYVSMSLELCNSFNSYTTTTKRAPQRKIFPMMLARSNVIFLDKMSGGKFDDVISFYVCVRKITIYKIIKRLLYGLKRWTKNKDDLGSILKVIFFF